MKGVRVIIFSLLYCLLLDTRFCKKMLLPSTVKFLLWPLFFTLSSNCSCKLPLFFKLALCVFGFHLGGRCEKGFRLLLDILALNLDSKAREN